MQVDVVMLANGKHQGLIDMTQNAIDSLHKSEPHIHFNVLVFDDLHIYKHCIPTIGPKPFNYNQRMNLGMAYFKNSPSEWIVLANNDLIFHPNWMSAILEANRGDPKILSFSPALPGEKHDQPVVLGYGVGGFVRGWCLIAKKEVFDRFKLDESVNFWCSDNVYNDALVKHNIPHAVVANSVVTHLGGATLFTENSETIHNLTAKQAEIYNRLPK